MYHVPQNIRNAGKILSCFAPERKHRLAKVAANNAFASSTELHVLRRLTHQCIADLPLTLQPVRLCKPSLAPSTCRPLLAQFIGEVGGIMAAKAVCTTSGRFRTKSFLFCLSADGPIYGEAAQFIEANGVC